jgi:hypothetical protein
MTNVDHFIVKDLFLIAKFCELTEETILDLVLKQYRETKSRKIG